MKRHLRFWILLLCGLLALGLVTGCDDDDDGGGDVAGEGGDDGDGIVDDADGDDVAEDDADGDDTTPPPEVVLTAPLLLSPADEETQIAVGGMKGVTFRWQAVPTATSYILKLKTTETPVTGTSHLMLLEADDSSYYSWKVRAVRGDTRGPFSPARKLYVRNMVVVIPAALAAPTLVQPANGRRFTGSGDIAVAYQWNAVTGADRYTLEVNGTTYDVAGTSRTITYSPRGFGYAWKVRARQGSTTGPWSATRTFTIN